MSANRLALGLPGLPTGRLQNSLRLGGLVNSRDTVMTGPKAPKEMYVITQITAYYFRM